MNNNNNKENIELFKVDKNSIGQDVSDNLKDYYVDFCQKVVKLVKENKLKDAIEMLNMEIESPYVPNSVLLMLTESRNQLEWDLKQQEYERNVNEMSPLQMWDKVYNANKGTIDVAYFNVLLEKKDNTLDEIDLEIIAKIFKDKKISNLDKVVIAMSLNKLMVSKEFKIFNNYLQKEYEFSPAKTEQLHLPSEELVKKAEDFYMKEPSKFQLFLNLVQLLYAYYFPSKIPYDDDEVVNTISNVIESFFVGKRAKENDITKVIYKMLEENNEKA